MPQKTYFEAARTVLERCDLLATFTEEPGRITRRFATLPMHQVHASLEGWLHAAGMHTELDTIGNLIGRYETTQPGNKTLLLGSHLDTVIDAGKYDGLLGVLVALACMERLHARGGSLPFAVELLGFADEEGLRYESVYTGSKAITGNFDPQTLEQRDTQGISMAEALHTFGLYPDQSLLTISRWPREELLGYCEVHIEQGPVLEAHDLPLAVVSSIVGQQRRLFQFKGVQGHAGTLPMDRRQDALCAAAEFALAVEALGRRTPGLVATVGLFQVQSGASNVVPGVVQVSLDIRHEDNATCECCADRIYEEGKRICTQRGIGLTQQRVQNSQTIFCAPTMVERWQRALTETGYPVFQMPSGAGHDAVAMSKLTDISMLFVRCRGGISHNPAEAVAIEDVAVAIEALERFLLLTAHEVAYGTL